MDDDALCKELHDNIMTRVFNAQSKDEIQKYKHRKFSEMKGEDISNVAFRTTLCVNEFRKKEDKQSKESGASRALFGRKRKANTKANTKTQQGGKKRKKRKANNNK